jgi:uncharacterized hydrophobic protein (TIGR00271 family)
MDAPASPGRRSLGRAVRTAVRGPARSLAEVREVVYLDLGDRAARLSRFSILLVLSAVVASAGVLADSTATVIGAMIIAPLATPIQAIAIGIVAGEPRRLAFSLGVLLVGSLVTIGVGAWMAWWLPDVIPLAENSQVTGRTSPSTIDLYAAAATGLAGALGIARRDVSDILPGVAIAISLVPPLAVVGVTMSAGDWSGSFGALLLFLTNVLAIIVTCAALFAALGYQRLPVAEGGVRRRRAYLVVAVVGVAVLVALGVLTWRSVQINNWTAAAGAAATEWADDFGGVVTNVAFEGEDLVVTVQIPPEAEPNEASLLGRLTGEVPSGTTLLIDQRLGSRRAIGEVP